MPEPVTVWKVELVRGREPIDVRGTLCLTRDALEFEDDDGETTRIRFDRVDRVRRLKISPVLVVRHLDRAAGETAFYFVEPPPLHPPDPGTLPLREATRRRPSKRRQHRDNTGYLTGKGTALKPTIQGWVSEVQERVSAARGAGR
jgi:hypothetical protein